MMWELPLGRLDNELVGPGLQEGIALQVVFLGLMSSIPYGNSMMPKVCWCSWLSQTTPSIKTRQAGTKGVLLLCSRFPQEERELSREQVLSQKGIPTTRGQHGGESEDLQLLSPCFLNKVSYLTHALWGIDLLISSISVDESQTNHFFLLCFRVSCTRLWI